MACTDFEFMIEEEIQAYLYNNRIKYDSAIQKPRHPICACLLFLIKVILVCLIIGGLGVAVVYYTPIWEMVENWMYPPQEEEAWFDFITNQIENILDYLGFY
ncbi:uncharacterized protein LOC109597865 [Aethina tumida]|uniref:uncharacterized protein LOC109597865 n=1 Tax=Aethina tumida TaxID=116153 RepID=UPI00096B12FC|nr:uncharacterized protein LOC109597865 [Aethina tumida]